MDYANTNPMIVREKNNNADLPLSTPSLNCYKMSAGRSSERYGDEEEPIMEEIMQKKTISSILTESIDVAE
jgi:hypothetical protein